MSSKLNLILFDFYNVLSKSHFYTNLANNYSGQHKIITQSLFSPEAYPLLSRWMRGDISYKDIHNKISPLVGLPASFLNKALIESVKQITLNTELLAFSQKMRSLGVRVAILTDNFDVFEEIYVPHANLDKKFDNIFSSASQKKLKLDNNGEIIFKAISKMNSQPENTLFIDDCKENGNDFTRAGGIFYQYDKYIDGHKDFIKWFENNFPSLANKIN